MSEMLTVKQWAEKAGLKLVNYDGFVRIYEKLAGEENVDFSTNIANRLRNAGEILCTRRGFQAGIAGCTIYFPSLDELEKMLEVIPEYVEDSVNQSISVGSLFRDKKDIRGYTETLLKEIKIKLKARKKCLELNSEIESIKLEELEGRILKPQEIEEIKAYGLTVEDAEIKLMQEIIVDLENLLEQKKIKFSKLPHKKIEFLMGLYSEVSKSRVLKPSEEEYMYINIPGIPKEPFVQPYSLIGMEGRTTGVAFDIQTNQGRVKGSMKTTPEVDAKIRKSQEKQEEYADLIGIEEQGSVTINLSENDVNHALEIIDSNVSKEERVGFMDRLEKFVMKIRDFFRRDGEDR